MPPQSKLLVLLFSDLVGSTAVKDRLRTSGYLPLLERHDALLREAIGTIQGALLQQDTGDGCFAVFSTASDAVRAALRFQWHMAAEPWPQGARLVSRVGIHLGEVVQAGVRQDGGNKLVGLAIDLAARVMSLAQGGQILITREAFNGARQFVSEHPADPSLALRWEAHGPYLLKGSDEPVEVFEVGVAGQAPLSPPPDTEKARRAVRAGDEATLGWRPALGRELEGQPNWEISRKLGEGGFGEVWLATHKKTGAARVFKFCFDAERLRGLKREVVLFRLLKEALGERRDIARVIDWHLDSPPYFIEMDYAPDGNLAEWAQRQGGIGNTPLQRRLEIVAQVADALGAAHSVGILHKDVKPSNVLIFRDADGRDHPRLTDFGIGILTDRSRLDALHITPAGFTQSMLTANESSRTGTRMYAPPESLQGRPHTLQGDVYALGVILYQMAAADLQRPIASGWERDVADDLLREDIAACVDVDLSRRPASAQEVALRIRSLEQRRAERTANARAAAEAGAARRREDEARKLAARRRVQARIAATAAMVLAIVAVAMIVLWRDARTQRELAKSGRAEADKQRGEAERQRGAATREAARATLEERRAKAQLANNYVDQAWQHHESGDPSVTLLKSAEALRLNDSVPNRARVAHLLSSAPRPCAWDPQAVAEIRRQQGALPTVSARHWASRNRDLPEWKALQVIDMSTGQPAANPLSHQGEFSCYELSPDGTRVVTGTVDGEARVWDALTGKPASEPMRHQPAGNGLYHVTFSPDGANVLTAGLDGTARVWEARTGRPLSTPMRHGGTVRDAAFSPDGKRIVTASIDKTARVWDWAGGEPVGEPMPHANFVLHASFSADGTRVLTVSSDVARVWDARSGQPVSEPMPHGGIDDASFSRDGARVVTASGTSARVWDARTGRPISPPMRHPDHDHVLHAALSPDGALVVTASRHGIARVWGAGSGQPLSAPMRHEGPVTHAQFTPDGTRVVTAGIDHPPRVWDPMFSQPLSELNLTDEPLGQAWFDADGHRVLTSRGIWDAVTGRKLSALVSGGRIIGPQAFTPDATRGVTQARDGVGMILDLSTGKQAPGLIRHNAAIMHVEFSPDQTRVLSASLDGTARIWDAAAGTPLGETITHQNAVNAASFAPDPSRVVTASSDNTARVWDSNNGRPLSEPMRHDAEVYRAAFSPDGAMIVTAAADNTARVWDASSGRAISEPMRHAESVWWAAFSPDGSRVVTASADGTARVWEARTGRAVSRPMRHRAQVSYAAFSPDGNLVCTLATKDLPRNRRVIEHQPIDPATVVPITNTVGVWDAMTGAPVSPPLQVADSSRPAALTDAGLRRLTAPADNAVYVWKVPAVNWPGENVVRFAELICCQRLDEAGIARALTPREWHSRFDDLSRRYPQEFLPPPSDGMLRAELERHPADAARLKTYGEWFYKRRSAAGAAKLLEKARTAGAQVDALTLARCYWLTDEYALAATEFEKAIALEKDVNFAVYLRTCLAAVRRDAGPPSEIPHR